MCLSSFSFLFVVYQAALKHSSIIKMESLGSCIRRGIPAGGHPPVAEHCLLGSWRLEAAVVEQVDRQLVVPIVSAGRSDCARRLDVKRNQLACEDLDGRCVRHAAGTARGGPPSPSGCRSSAARGRFEPTPLIGAYYSASAMTKRVVV